MRIGIDCLRIDPSFVGGLNTYTLGLLDGFAAAGNGHQFELYVSRLNHHLFSKFADRKGFELVVVDSQFQEVRSTLCRAILLSRSPKLYELVSNLAFRNLRAMMDASSDIIYTPAVVLQSFNSRKPTVLSMHDIQHVHYPQFFDWSRRLGRKITYALSARHADYFHASSHFVRCDLMMHFPEIRPERIEVIPGGVNVAELSARIDPAVSLEQYILPDRFLLYPAQLWPHKNHITVLRALKRIEERDGLQIPLVMTGARYSAASQVLRFIAEESMNYCFYLGKVPFRVLVALYQRAAFLLMPTLYEASSLPVLEAAAAGTPIIASRTPPHEELGEVLQMNLFHPLDVEALSRLILDLWKDRTTPSSQAAYNRENIAFYSWENTARKYLQLFARIVN